ncbi:molecular chaperone [Escherichia coli]|uniref:fimbrial biogenesis chaperone n=1 Tax=Escherichia coli TaxID=562 RepID=UPI0002A43915|nr:molecular chaperone [Escherichia coli]HBP1558568.1 molecular chaperone [Escherichia coli str. K-12 substr. MG1655star]EEX0331640.1 molecular chaperone [Escherichia coli]EFA5452273.1 molecular chaperone [Escherichia coli]EFK4675244.1 molecular chaperone [Escherichia coli]EFK5800184.1 molecular chaperone [Escherichia coli]
MRKLYSVFILTGVLFCSCVEAASFGPRESMLIFDGRKNSSSYRLDNTDTHLPWLVQAWVEDVNEKRTDVFTSVPLVFRVEPSSTFTVRIVKKSAVPEDRETLYWAVSNSLPGGERSEQKAEDDKISAQLSLAYRFKVPMIYRPAALAGKPQQPESLQWHADKGGKMTVHNPTRYVVQLNYVNAGGKRYQGKGVSWFISPEKSVTVDVSAGTGSRIKYGVVNDYGAVREYEGIVR